MGWMGLVWVGLIGDQGEHSIIIQLCSKINLYNIEHVTCHICHMLYSVFFLGAQNRNIVNIRIYLNCPADSQVTFSHTQSQCPGRIIT